jgi:hypothetical protein
VDFNGTSDYAEANPGPAPAGALTIVAKVWLDGCQNWGGLVERYTVEALDCWAFGFESCSKLVYYWSFGNPFWNTYVIGNSSVPTGQWVQVAVASNGTTATFYINGVADGTFPVGATCTTGKINIGGNLVGNDEYFDGKIDDLQIYDRYLTQAEIQALM